MLSKILSKKKIVFNYFNIIGAMVLLLLTQFTNCSQFTSNEVAPGSSNFSTPTHPSIFGEPDLVPINKEDFEKTSLAKTVGLFLSQHPNLDEKNEIPGCTGIQISRKHILTAAHCRKGDFIFDKGRLASVQNMGQIEFLTIGGFVNATYPAPLIDNYPDSQLRWQISGPIYANKRFDYAIFESETPMDDAIIDLLNVTDQIEELAVMGFPDGLPLSISEDCQGMSKPGHKLFRHNCDTLPGSSGGLVINRTTGIPVGLHTAGTFRNGASYYDANGKFETVEDVAAIRGCIPEIYPDAEDFDRCLMLYVMNRGVFFTTIARSLAKEAPELWDDILYWAKEDVTDQKSMVKQNI